MSRFFTLEKIEDINGEIASVSIIKDGKRSDFIMPRSICSIGRTYYIDKKDEVHKVSEMVVKIEKIQFRDVVTGKTFAKVEILENKAKEIIPTTTNIISGYFPLIYLEEEFLVKGFWGPSSKGDLNFQVLSFEKSCSSGKNTVINFLKTSVPKLSQKTIDKMIDYFGYENVLEIVKKDSQRLFEIGISTKTADRIIFGVGAAYALEEVFLFLSRFDISPTNIIKIYKEYQLNSQKFLVGNPYKALNDGLLSLKECDDIARFLGLNALNDERTYSVIQLFLKEESKSHGDMFTYLDKINSEISSFSRKIGDFKHHKDYEVSDIWSALTKMDRKEIFIDNSDVKGICIYHSYFKYIEDVIVNRLLELTTNINPRHYEADKVTDFISYFESSSGLKMAAEQKNAVHMALKNKFSILTGGPGTGKTQTINAIIKCIKSLFPSATVELCAPTGKASKRMSELTGQRAFTIHKRLKYIPFTKNDELEPIDADFLIVDEASMIDADLFSKLLLNVNDNSSILFVGDYNQLPSVGIGLILRDLIESKKIATVKLKKIFRQAQHSQIVTLAHSIANGIGFDSGLKIDSTKTDFDFLECKTNIEIENLIFKEIAHFHNDLHISFEDIQVLTPMNQGDIGTIMLNQKLREYMNPLTGKSKELVINPRLTLRTNDRVMQIKNNYKIRVFNGSIGTVLNIFQKDGEDFVIIDFDGDSVEYNLEFAQDLVLSYASTIHKSQGSEFPVVIMPISESHNLMLSKNLIYTGITRAREYLRMVGSKSAFNKGIVNLDNTTRNSHIIAKIQEKFV